MDDTDSQCTFNQNFSGVQGCQIFLNVFVDHFVFLLLRSAHSTYFHIYSLDDLGFGELNLLSSSHILHINPLLNTQLAETLFPFYRPSHHSGDCSWGCCLFVCLSTRAFHFHAVSCDNSWDQFPHYYNPFRPSSPVPISQRDLPMFFSNNFRVPSLILKSFIPFESKCLQGKAQG